MLLQQAWNSPKQSLLSFGRMGKTKAYTKVDVFIGTETNDTKIIQKYIELTRQRMVKRNRTNQLKTFEQILKKPRKTQRRKQVKKPTDLWKMFKMIKPRKSYF